jgi:hypothetical protein
MSFELLVLFNSKLKTQHSKLLFRCHGDRSVPARFGHGPPFCHLSAKWEPPVGGLSQPRRDAADPKNND